MLLCINILPVVLLGDLVLLAEVQGEDAVTSQLEQDWILGVVLDLLGQGKLRTCQREKLHLLLGVFCVLGKMITKLLQGRIQGERNTQVGTESDLYRALLTWTAAMEAIDMLGHVVGRLLKRLLRTRREVS